MNSFKKCPNGHYYDSSMHSTCPYCPSASSEDSFTNNQNKRTREYEHTGNSDDAATKAYNINFNDAETVSSNKANDDNVTVSPELNNTKQTKESDTSHRTMFFDETETESEGKSEQKPREYRKLAGWLVSYTLDEAGVDFRIYEGRNMIGRDSDCQICIPDSGVTSKHAVLLYRNGKYSITDQQSSNGTYVNGNDIDLEPKYLNDGDEIRVGKTILKFRSSL